jgi:hypothetical protein
MYEKRHRRYEMVEKKQRMREKEQLQFEHYKLKERIEQLRTMDSQAFLSLPPEIFPFSAPTETYDETTRPPSTSSIGASFGIGPSSATAFHEAERRRDLILGVAMTLDERYRTLLPPRYVEPRSHPPNDMSSSGDAEEESSQEEEGDGQEEEEGSSSDELTSEKTESPEEVEAERENSLRSDSLTPVSEQNEERRLSTLSSDSYMRSLPREGVFSNATVSGKVITQLPRPRSPLALVGRGLGDDSSRSASARSTPPYVERQPPIPSTQDLNNLVSQPTQSSPQYSYRPSNSPHPQNIGPDLPPPQGHSNSSEGASAIHAFNNTPINPQILLGIKYFLESHNALKGSSLHSLLSSLNDGMETMTFGSQSPYPTTVGTPDDRHAQQQSQPESRPVSDVNGAGIDGGRDGLVENEAREGAEDGGVGDSPLPLYSPTPLLPDEMAERDAERPPELSLPPVSQKFAPEPPRAGEFFRSRGKRRRLEDGYEVEPRVTRTYDDDVLSAKYNGAINDRFLSPASAFASSSHIQPSPSPTPSYAPSANTRDSRAPSATPSALGLSTSISISQLNTEDICDPYLLQFLPDNTGSASSARNPTLSNSIISLKSYDILFGRGRRSRHEIAAIVGVSRHNDEPGRAGRRTIRVGSKAFGCEVPVFDFELAGGSGGYVGFEFELPEWVLYPVALERAERGALDVDEEGGPLVDVEEWMGHGEFSKEDRDWEVMELMHVQSVQSGNVDNGPRASMPLVEDSDFGTGKGMGALERRQRRVR